MTLAGGHGPRHADRQPAPVHRRRHRARRRSGDRAPAVHQARRAVSGAAAAPRDRLGGGHRRPDLPGRPVPGDRPRQRRAHPPADRGRVGHLARVGGSSTTPISRATGRNDRGMVDLLDTMPDDPARKAAAALLEVETPIVVCTGFPVNGSPETDGPPGAFALIDALCALGKTIKLASWLEALQIFRTVWLHD